MGECVLRTQSCRRHAGRSADFRILRCPEVRITIDAPSHHVPCLPGGMDGRQTGITICRTGRTAPSLCPYKFIASVPLLPHLIGFANRIQQKQGLSPSKVSGTSGLYSGAFPIRESRIHGNSKTHSAGLSAEMPAGRRPADVSRSDQQSRPCTPQGRRRTRLADGSTRTSKKL
jgi:hypothetical protein